MTAFEVYHIANVSDPLGYWEVMEGDSLEYSKSHLDVPVLCGRRVLVSAKDNYDLGFAINCLMRGLRAKKIKPKHIEVLPIDYVVLDYEDILKSVPYVIATL